MKQVYLCLRRSLLGFLLCWGIIAASAQSLSTDPEFSGSGSGGSPPKPFRECYLEDFGFAENKNFYEKKSTKGNINAITKFRKERLGEIDTDKLIFYNSSGAIIGQSENWGPTFTEYTWDGKKKLMGAYSVVTNSAGYNQPYFHAGPDHTPGDGSNGYMLLVDSHKNTETYFDRVWDYGDGIAGGRGYRFSLWLKNVNNQNPGLVAPQVRVRIYDVSSHPNVLLVEDIFSPPANTPGDDGPEWREFVLKINRLPAGATKLRLRISNVVANEFGNDLAIDDIGFCSVKIEAKNDCPSTKIKFNSSVGGVTAKSVLVNDKVNGEEISLSSNPLPVLLTPGTSPVPGFVSMDEKGFITVKPGTPPGIYEYSYTICSTKPGLEDVCDTAKACFEVKCDGITVVAGAVIDVRNSPAAPIVNVPISLVPQFAGADTLRQWTNANGEFRFTGVPEGDYLVQVQDHYLITHSELFPVTSSLHFGTVEKCKPIKHIFEYEYSNFPVIGDFVWLDVNDDEEQNEWFDANGDNRISKNDINIENFEAISYQDWEWIDINGNDTWDGADDFGELNKAGIGNASYKNIVVTGPEGYRDSLVVGVDGLWRDRPRDARGDGLFGDFVATLVREPVFDSLTVALWATGKVKTFDNDGNAVVNSGGRVARRAIAQRNSRTAAEEVYMMYGSFKEGAVSFSQPQNLSFDIPLNVRDSPLPVSWVDFSARWNSEEKAVALEWRTEFEIDNEGFDIEHSVDAASWKKVGFVKAETPDSDRLKHYKFSHAEAKSGVNYYRLKQMDLFGNFDYSVIQSVTILRNDEIAIYPNPAADLLHVSESTLSRGLKAVSLFDPVGRNVREYKTHMSTLNLTGLTPGIYHVKMTFDDDTFEVVKILKK